MSRAADKRRARERAREPWAARVYSPSTENYFTLSYGLFDECVERYGADAIINPVKLIRDRLDCSIAVANALLSQARERGL